MPPRTAQPSSPGPAPGLARNASLLSFGAVASRLLGLIRDMVIAAYFGASGLVSAFAAASIVPTMLYDLLIGGMLSAALVPVLSDFAGAGQRRSGQSLPAAAARAAPNPEFVRLVGALLGLAAVTLAAIVLCLALFAPQVAWLLVGGFEDFDPALLPLTVHLLRLISPVVWFFSMAGLLTAVLYSLQRFSAPALATAVYNLGIVAAAPLLAERIGIASLAVGILAGSMAQFSLMAWDVRRAGLRLSLRWSHPALPRIVKLYLPIAAGLVVAQLQVALDRRLASATGVQSIAWMRNATTLQQLPLGTVSVAVSLAALPRLSQQFAAGEEAAYRRTLSKGLRMVLVLIAPALVALWLLAEPTVRILYERGPFTASDSAQVVAALRVYLLGALFAAIDFPLIYAFYARNNTLLPALMGVLSALVYVGVALALVAGMGYLGLVWADTAKQAAHAAAMLLLLLWKLGLLQRRRSRTSAGGPIGGRMAWTKETTTRTLLSVAAAAATMAAVVAVLSQQIGAALAPSLAADVSLVAGAAGAGLIVYAATLMLAGQAEAKELCRALLRMGRNAGR